jgi:cytochrome c553
MEPPTITTIRGREKSVALLPCSTTLTIRSVFNRFRPSAKTRSLKTVGLWLVEMFPALQRKCALLPAVIVVSLAFAAGACRSRGFPTPSNPQLNDRSNPSPLILIGSNGSKPISITPQAREEALSIFAERCAVCHGDNGDGTGPGASNLNPKPANFRSPKWQSSVSDERIATIIVNGGTSVGLSASMASNPDLEGQPDVVAALVEHIRKFGK